MALLPELSREQRQLARKRGAGRTLVDDAPVKFARRKSLAPIAANDQLVALKAAKTPRKTNVQEPFHAERKRKPRMMDFATPKTAKKAIRPAASVSPVAAIDSPGMVDVSVQHEDVAVYDIPDATGLETDLTPDTEVPLAAAGTPSRKRAASTTVRAKAKRLRGLLRELGPGASRFIVGAKNYATPEKAASSERRVSMRLTTMANQVSVPIRVIRAPTKESRISKVAVKASRPISTELLSICALRQMGLTWKVVSEVLNMPTAKASKLWRSQSADTLERARQQALQHANGAGMQMTQRGLAARPLVNCEACRKRTKEKCRGKCQHRAALVNDFTKSLDSVNHRQSMESDGGDVLDLL